MAGESEEVLFYHSERSVSNEFTIPNRFGPASVINNVVFIFTPRFIKVIVLSVKYKQAGIFPSSNILENTYLELNSYSKGSR
jgi:hypothetical protein